MPECVVFAVGYTKDTPLSVFHELIKLPDIPFSFLLTEVYTGEFDVILQLP